VVFQTALAAEPAQGELMDEAARSNTEQKETRHHQEKVGVVTSAKMQKTIVVEVRRRVAHPVYKRIITKRSKFMAHDEHGKAHEGDMVRIVETRPLSKSKRWSLKEVVRAAAGGA
jgi:small subunit ribosomal protein S17